ncbi:hypothetical protein JW826_05485 [Candidatus Woesearchaeota archaeon]|nr:hypothetical protein [Candidatus Woesearchaeota archaeon]
MKQKVNEAEVLETLVCEDIPDTRAMQAYRLKAAGIPSSNEEYMQKHYPAAWKQAKTISRMPAHHQKQVFKMSIPLAFPSGDYPLTGFDPDEKPPKTDHHRWQSNFMSDGAMHVTTENNLNKILKIFVKNDLPIRLRPAYGKLLDNQRELDSGIVVPYGWRVDTYDPCQLPSYHQYVVFNRNLFAAPYWWRHIWTIRTEKKDDPYNKSALHFTMETTTHVKYCCDALFFSTDYPGSGPLEKFLQERCESEDQRDLDESRESRHGKLTSTERRVLKVGEPILIYDPEWIEPGLKRP